MRTSIRHLPAVIAAVAVAVVALPFAQAATDPNSAPRTVSAAERTVSAQPMKPLASRPAAMSTAQWFSTHPRKGFSFATQSVAYANGLQARENVERVRRGETVVTTGGKTYTQSNWQAYRKLVNTGRWQLYGLPRWYDDKADNNGFVVWDETKPFLTPAARVNGEYPVTPGVSYDPSRGFEPNYFRSKKAQDRWVAENKIMFNRTPFDHMANPDGTPVVYTDLECLRGALWMYSDGMTPAPNDGEWAKSWDRVKAAHPEFDPANGTSPYRR